MRLSDAQERWLEDKIPRILGMPTTRIIVQETLPRTQTKETQLASNMLAKPRKTQRITIRFLHLARNLLATLLEVQRITIVFLQFVQILLP